MAITWKDVSESEAFRSQMDGNREKIRGAFFDTRIKDKLPENLHKEAANQFYEKTKDDVYPPTSFTPDDSIPELGGSKAIGAFMVGMGAGMRDTYDGVKQIFSIGEEQLDKDREYYKQLTESPEYGGLAVGGQVTGLLAEPITTLLLPIMPELKGKSLFDIAKIGAVTGAGFGSVGYVSEGQSRMGNVLLGTVSGGTISPVFAGLGRGMSKLLDLGESRASTHMLNSFETKVHQFQAAGASPSLANRAAKRFFSLSDSDLTSALMKSERGKIRFAKNPEQAANFIEDASRQMENKLSNTFNPNTTLGKIRMSTIHAKTVAGKYGTEFLTPILSEINRIYPRLGGALNEMEFESHKHIAKAFEIINPFTETYKSILKRNPNIAEDIKKGLLSGDFKGVKNLVAGEKNGLKFIKQFDEVNKVLGKLYGQLRETGYDIPKLDNYWPRVISNLEGVTKVEHSVVTREFDRLAKIKGRKLTLEEQKRAIKHLYSPGMQEKVWGKTSSSLKQRKWAALDDELLPHYADPIDSLNHYVHQNIQDVQRRKFMKKFGYSKKPAIDGSDLEDSIESVIIKAREDGHLSPEHEGFVIDSLKARFGPGEKAPHQAIQVFKNTAYTVTLGNPLSAMTQFADLLFSAHKYGIFNAVNTVFGKKLIKKEAMGLMDAAEELAGDRNAMKRLADWSFKWGGFNKIDRLGKETYVNAALKHYNKLAIKDADKIRNEWGKIFGVEETESLIKDLQGRKLTDNVKLLLWNELSEVQPISLSQMPLKYLQSPNGRIFYTLKTFTIKQLDFMRKQIYDEYAAGNKVSAIKNATKFMALFLAANSTVDAAKDVLKGKEINMEDHIVDNIWSLVGMNKYTFKTAKEKGVGSAVLDFIAPPLNVFDDLTRSIDDPKRIWNLIPPFGKLVYNWKKSEQDKYLEFTDIGKDFEDQMNRETEKMNEGDF